ncbi:hypothetical protein DXG01_000027 [Tephrocybe rancida]|nr:hypothetical protein DXG01_000027 [Tephrocybe rancida]
MLRTAIARSARASLTCQRLVPASRLSFPGFQIRFESTTHTPLAPKTRTPEEQARKEVKDHMNELQHDWDAKEITYAELKPRTDSPVSVRVGFLAFLHTVVTVIQQDTYLIDVREPDEVVQGMIPSAVNLPLSVLGNSLHLHPSAFLEKHGFEKPGKDQQLIFYCRSGKRSTTASDVAKRNGFTNILNYKGSWLEWVEKENTQK